MNRRAGGFTLIELLIGLALVGITLTLAFAGLRFAGRSQERSDALVRQLEEVRVAYNVVQRQLAQARPLLREAPQRQATFRGEPTAVEFVAPSPTQDGRLSGLFHYRLRFAPTARGTALMLDHQPYLPSKHFDWSEGHDSEVLVDGLAGGQFGYFGHTEAQARESWVPAWPVTESLPLLVRVQLERGAAAAVWPELVVPLRAHRVR